MGARGGFKSYLHRQVVIALALTAVFSSASAAIDPYVSRCLANRDEGQTVRVEGNRAFQCKDSNESNARNTILVGAPTNFDLAIRDGRIFLTKIIYLSYSGPVGMREASINRILGARQCMVDFFARYDIQLDLSFLTSESYPTEADNIVTLRPEAAHGPTANANNWFSHVLDGVTLTDGQVCSLNMHELAHLLGLNDTYPEDICANRKIGPKNDLMRVPSKEPHRLRLYPYQIKRILKPLCGLP